MRRTSSRRSSILKPPRGSLRAPDLDLDGLPFDDEDGYTQPSNRRVSFSRISKVQEFDPTIANLAQCMYQETVNIEEGEDIKVQSVSVCEENIKTSSLDQNRRRRKSGQFKKDNCGDMSDFCRDLDVTQDNSAVDNSVFYHVNKTTDLYNSTMIDWEGQSVASGMVNIHQSAVEDKKRMYAYIESPTKIDPKRMKVKSTSQVQFDRTFGTEMDMTVTFGGIEGCELKRETSGFGMEMTEAVGKILTGRTNEGKEDDSLNWNLPGENVYSEENDSLLSKLTCMGINTPVSTTKEQNVFKSNPVFSVENENPNTDMDKTGTHGKLEIQSMPAKVCVLEENSMHKENIHPEMLLKKGQKINRDLFLGETSVRDSSVLHSKRENVWEGKTPKSSGKIDYSVQDVTVTCPDGMEFTLPLGQLLPTKLERTVEGEISAMSASKNPAFNCPSQAQNVPNLLQDHSSMFSIPKGRKGFSSMFERNNEANFETVRDENVYLGNVQENKFRENQETDINDISGLELTVPCGKLIHYNMSKEDEHINDNEKENAPNQRSQTIEKILSDSVHKNCMNSSKNAGQSNDEGQSCLNISSGQLNQTFPDNDGMEFTVPLGKLLVLNQVNKNAKRLEETNQEMDGMDLTVPLGKLSQFKPSHISENVEQLKVSSQQIDQILSNSEHRSCINSTNNAVHSNDEGQSCMNDRSRKLNQTFPENDGMDSTIPQGKLIQFKQSRISETVENLEVSSQQIGQILSNPEHQSCVNSTKNAVHSNNDGQSRQNSRQLNQTFPETDAMELTVPQGKFSQFKPSRISENIKQLEVSSQQTDCILSNSVHQSCLNDRSRQLNQTFPENDGMELTVSQGKFFQFEPSHISENVEKVEVSSQQIDRIFSNPEHQSCINSTKDVVHSNDEGQSCLNDSNKQLNQMFPETDGMELTVPLVTLLDLKPCNNVNESIPKHEEVNSKVDGLESSVHHSTLFQVEPEAAKTKDAPRVVVEDNNVTLSRGSLFRKSSYSFSESNVSRREENMPNASVQENGGRGYGQLLSFCNETIRGEHEMETSISSKIGEASVHSPADNHCPENEGLEEKAPQENAVKNFHPVNKNLNFHPAAESFTSRSTLQVIVENSVENEISGDLSNAQMEISSKSSSLQNPVCSEQELTDQNQIRRVDLKSVLPNNAVEENTLGIDEKEGSGRISEPSIPEEVTRLVEVMENVVIEENLLVFEKKTEKSISDYSVMKTACNESRGSKRENPFRDSMSNCKKGIIERLSTKASVPEEESVSEPKETQPIALNCLDISEKVTELKNVEEEIHDVDNVVLAEVTDDTRKDEKQAKNEPYDLVSEEQVCSQTNEEEAVEKRDSQPGNELSIVPKKDSSDICAANNDTIEFIQEISEQSILHSTLLSKDFDLEEWMKEETSKKWCSWKIRKLEDTEWSFYVLFGRAKLTLKLKSDAIPSETKSRSVDRMELESLMDVGNKDCDYLINNIFLERCSPTILESLCGTTDQLPDLFEFIDKEIKILGTLDRQTTRLFRNHPVIFKGNGFIFSVQSRILMKLFYVVVDLTGWKDGCIEANAVKVINKLGNTREKDIQDILKTIKKDDIYLIQFYKEVNSFVKMLESLKE